MTHLENKALILEDDSDLALTLADFLLYEGFESKIANSINDAITLTSKESFLFYILDAKLPDGNSFSLLQDLRNANDLTPAIFLTSLTDKSSVMSGFKAGCDDYIKKPFDIDELGAKIKVLLKRSYGISEDNEILICDGIKFYKNSNTLESDSTQTTLTQKEKALLFLLIKNKNQITTKDMISSEVWDGEFSDGSLRIYISRLKTIFKDRLLNVRGEGYKLVL